MGVLLFSVLHGAEPRLFLYPVNGAMRFRIGAMGFQVGGDGLYLKIDQRDLIAKLTPGFLDLFSQGIMAFQHQIKLFSDVPPGEFQGDLFP